MSTNDIFNRVITDLWRVSWQSAIIIPAVLVLRFVLGRHLPACWRCGLWMLIGLRLILPALPHSPLSLFNLWSQKPQLLNTPVTTISYTEQNLPFPSQPPLQIEHPAIHWPEYLLLAWATGILFFSARLLIVNTLFAMRVARSSLPAPAQIEAMLLSCRDELAMRRLPRAIITPAVYTPALFGLLNPHLLLPTDFALCLDERQKRLVLLHEMAHLRRHDLLAGWIAAALQILHWFNPLVWLAGAYWRADMESACDELLLTSMAPEQRADYGALLLKLALRLAPLPPPPAVAIIGGKFELKRRILSISRFSRPAAPWSIAGALLVLTFAVVGLTDAQVNPAAQPANDQSPAQKNTELRIYDMRPLLPAGPPYDAAKANEDIDAIRLSIARQVGAKDMARIHTDFDNRTGELVVSAPPFAQALIAASIRNFLRPNQKPVVAIAIRFIAAKELPLQLPASTSPQSGSTLKMLSDDQLTQILQAVDKGDGSIVSAPRIIADYGQTAKMSVGTSNQYVSDLKQAPKGVIAITDTVATGIEVTTVPHVNLSDRTIVLQLTAQLTELQGFDKKLLPGHDNKWIVEVPRKSTTFLNARLALSDGASAVASMPNPTNDSPPNLPKPDIAAGPQSIDLPDGQRMFMIVTANIIAPPPNP